MRAVLNYKSVTLTCLLCLAAVFVLIGPGRSVSMGDLIAISAVSWGASAILLSFSRSPSQFIAALSERGLYIVRTPVYLFLILMIFCVRVGIIFLKLSIKSMIWLFGSIIYFLFPIDLIPDFVVVLGQMDDIFVAISLGFWVFATAMTSDLRRSIEISRPKTSFP